MKHIEEAKNLESRKKEIITKIENRWLKILYCMNLFKIEIRINSSWKWLNGWMLWNCFKMKGDQYKSRKI